VLGGDGIPIGRRSQCVSSFNNRKLVSGQLVTTNSGLLSKCRARSRSPGAAIRRRFLDFRLFRFKRTPKKPVRRYVRGWTVLSRLGDSRLAGGV
jgi:hypothetical protein